MSRFVTVGTLDALPVGACLSIEQEGHGIALCNSGGTLYALDNTCPHAGGPLGEGLVDGDIVECPWPGWRFNLRTGERPENQDISVGCFEVRVVGKEIQVALPASDGQTGPRPLSNEPCHRKIRGAVILTDLPR